MEQNSKIHNALLKYGYNSFSLEIIEYCDPSNCIEREQYYIDLLNPEYNILKTAGSLLGFKHSKESIEKISDSLVGNKRAAGNKRAKGAGNPGIKVEVLDQETGIITVYSSMSETAKALGVPSGSIRK